MSENLLRRAYAAFNAHDIDGALALMHPDVDWPNGMEGGQSTGMRRSAHTGSGSSQRSTREPTLRRSRSFPTGGSP